MRAKKCADPLGLHASSTFDLAEFSRALHEPAAEPSAHRLLTAPMARRLKNNRRFAKPVVMADGTRLESLADAMKFLNGLPRERVTAPLYYAAALVNDAIESGRAADTEKARLELIRAIRSEG
jgi:hypothetical protein